MTQDEIIEMARQAGFWKDLFSYPEFKEHVEAFAKLVAAKERLDCFDAAYQAYATSEVLKAIKARCEE